jgi:hypothetical protein
MNNNYSCVILNVNGSCLDSLAQFGFGGIIRNTFRHYFAGFSDFISKPHDILFVEFYAIYKDLLLVRDMDIDKLICYSDSLHCVNPIKSPQVKFHIHVVLIQNIKEVLSQTYVSLHHTLRERNQCAYFFVKLGGMSTSWLMLPHQKASAIFLGMMQ